MTFEQRVEGALRAADRFEPSPDLFAKVRQSIQDDETHRARVRRVLFWIGLALVLVVAYLLLTVDVDDGVWTMPYLALELLVLSIMVATVVVIGPSIRRFGETFEQAVFGDVPRTGADVLRLLDIAYYLIFGAFTLMTMSFAPPFDIGDTLIDWISWAQLRLGGLLLMMGVLHVMLVLALPLVGLVHSANRRRIRMAHGGRSTDRLLDKVDSAITAVIWVLVVLAMIQFLPLLIGLVTGIGGNA